MASWYYVQNNQTMGPVDDTALRSLATQGVLNSSSNVMPVGGTTWATLRDFEGQLGLTRDAYGSYAGGFGASMAPPPGGFAPGSSIPPPPGYSSTFNYGTPFNAGMVVYAEWWRRLVALILDGLVLAIPGLIISGIFGRVVTVGGGGRPVFDGNWVFAQLLYLAVAVAYFGYMHSTSGQTFGKKALGIKVVKDGSNELLSFGSGAGRYVVVQLISAVTCGLFALIDGLWPLWDSKKQALHDKIVGSVVVKA
ncbi:MAG: RDD family protein [Acidimicrobiia bacterium]